VAKEIFTGARAKFFLNDVPIGYCAGVSGEEAIDYEPVDTLEFLQVREHVPVAYRASMSAAFFRLIGSSLKSYAGKDEDAGGLEIFPKFNNILHSGAMTAAIHETKSKSPQVPRVIAQFQDVRAASKTFDVSSRGIVTENCSFVAINQLDESEIDI
tara:strand:- start:5713 stop:6180 length:468 start_codon:yes stop_codon:yes gene_type:complete